MLLKTSSMAILIGPSGSLLIARTLILALLMALCCALLSKIAHAESHLLTISQLSHYRDDSGSQAVETVLSDRQLFTPFDASETQLDYQGNQHTHWILFRVKTQQLNADPRQVLSIRSPWSNQLSLYRVYEDGSNRYVRVEESRQRPGWSWLASNDAITFPLQLQSGTDTLFLLELHPTSLIRVSLKLYSIADYIDRLWERKLQNFVYYGAVLTTIIFTVFINLKLLNKVFYAAYALTIVYLTYISDQVYVAGFIENLPWSPILYVNIFMLLASFFLAKFHQLFLDTHHGLPSIHYLLRGLPAAGLAIVLLTGTSTLSPLFIAGVFFVTVIACIGASLHRYQKGFKPALYLGLASCGYFIGAGPSVILAVIDAPQALQNLPFFKFGVTINFVLITVALIQFLYLREHEHNAIQADFLEASQQNQSLKSLLFSSMSHELLTPLNGIRGALEMLKDAKLTGKARDSFTIIRRCNNAIYGMIRMILMYIDYSNTETTLVNEPYNLRTAIRVTERYSRSECENQGIALNVDGVDSLPEWINAPLDAVPSVIGILLSYAIRQTDEGGVKLSIFSRTVDESSHRKTLRFEIRDTGAKMPKDQQEALFHLSSLHTLHSQKTLGRAGLGLVMAKMLSDRIGGTIHSESDRENGCRFVFETEVECIESPERLASLNREGPSSARVLLVDDNAVNLMVIRRQLENIGCQVTVAGNGQSALELAASQDFDLIFMDCHMPVMDGVTATREIRKLDSNRAEVPIVAITANVMQHDRNECINAGMNDYIEKPVQPETLKKALVTWTDHASAA